MAKTVLPEATRRRIAQIAALPERIDSLERELSRLETLLHESRDETWERSRERWRHVEPDPDLTWGLDLNGDAFVERADAYGAFGPEKAIVEIGPGYGRLLSSCLRRGLAFASYTGVDISTANVNHLTERFAQADGVTFIEGDVETVQLPQPADTVMSSLTFKHFFPSFEPALNNLASQMNPGGVAIIDLIEGERRYFEPDGITYIRWYTRSEIEAITLRCGLQVAAFDEVHHSPSFSRLLLVARKSS
jgi:SAM-dependent methyltransferase